MLRLFTLISLLLLLLVPGIAAADDSSWLSSDAPQAEEKSKITAPEGMVAVPAGEFTMGSNEQENEKPVHKVYLNAFAIDRTEVTVSAFRACMKAGHCSTPDE